MNRLLIEEINKNRRLMNLMEESPELVRLGDTSYSNVEFDTDGTEDDYVNKTLLDDIQKAASSVDIVATVTTAKKGHNQYVKDTDVESRHWKNVAVDIALLDGIGSDGATNSENGNEKFRELGNKLKDALVNLGYKLNSESGNDKAVLWQTNEGGNHFNHLHVSNRTNMSSEESESDSTYTLDQVLKLEYNGKPISEWIGEVPDILTALADLYKLSQSIKKPSV